jgi:hypothetical protein
MKQRPSRHTTWQWYRRQSRIVRVLVALAVLALVLFAYFLVGFRWQTVQTFSGSGDQTTGTFTVPGDWRIAWQCQGFMDGTGIDGLLRIDINTPDTSAAYPFYASCKAGGTSTGEESEHQGGQVSLTIKATGAWRIQIREFLPGGFLRSREV